MNYYCLIAGLRELTAEGERKGFDAAQIRAEIEADLSQKDARAVALLTAAYDVENIVAHRLGSDRFLPFGNIPQDELDAPQGLPQRMAQVVKGYSDENEDEEFDSSERFERALWSAWYEECAHSRIQFLQRWAEADLIIRTTIAGQKIADSDEELTDRAASIIAETNLIERERRLALLRWEQADTFSEQHYFDITAVLAYIVKINIVARQMAMNDAAGREMLGRFIKEINKTELQ